MSLPVLFRALSLKDLPSAPTEVRAAQVPSLEYLHKKQNYASSSSSECSPVKIPDMFTSTEAYVDCMKRNLTAEYLAAVKCALDKSNALPDLGWVRFETLTVKRSTRYRIMRSKKDTNGDHWGQHLVHFKSDNRIYFVLTHIDGVLSVLGRKSDEIEGDFRDLGYFGSFVALYKALCALKDTPLLKQILNPKLIKAVIANTKKSDAKALIGNSKIDVKALNGNTYRNTKELDTTTIPCNAAQAIAVKSLRSGLDFIQGPPGVNFLTRYREKLHHLAHYQL